MSMKILRIALVLGLLLMLPTFVASADPPDPPAHLGRAMFLDFPDCWIFDMDFNWYYIEDCSPTISLITNSRTGVLLWHAQAQLPVDDPNVVLPEKGAYKFTYENSGFACWWDEGVETTNYSIIITPDGKFIVSCHFRPDKWQPY
jgi:hypothetical protein